MKKIFAAALLALAMGHANAQKYDRETLESNHVHIPARLIYDQIKTYSYNVSMSSGDPSQWGPLDVAGKGYKFNSFNPAPYASADMKINLVMGPFSYVGEKTISRNVEEEVNKVKTKYTVYKRVLEFRYPMTAEAMNAKNNVRLYHNVHPAQDVRSIETSEYRTEGEAASIMEKTRTERLQSHIQEHILRFIGGVNSTLADHYDFYPSTSALNIFQFKKWDRDDEYNKHVSHVKQIMKVMTAGEPVTAYQEKLKEDLTYFQSFEGQFKPDDKKEDILYFGNYMNLATLYYCLDDLDKAKYYLAKLDSSDKKDNFVASLRNYVNSRQARMDKHLLTTTHLDYNPAKDFRLAGKNFTSDALSSAENTLKALGAGGLAAANDMVRFTNGTTAKGKVIWFAESNMLKLLTADKPDQPLTLNPDNTISFTLDTLKFVAAKHNQEGMVTKQFFKVAYKSEKILLLKLFSAAFTETEHYAIIRPSEELVTYFIGLGMKKGLAKYFEDCEAVSKKAKDGDYGAGLRNADIKQFIEMCTDYTDCK